MFEQKTKSVKGKNMSVSLERFRGLLAAHAPKQVPEVELVSFEDGWVLSFQGNVLQSARGERRVFRTGDAAVRYIRDNVVSVLDRAVAVKVLVAPGLF